MHVSDTKIAEGQKEKGAVAGRSTHELVRFPQPIEKLNEKQLLEALWRSPNQHHQIGVLDAKSNRFNNLQVKDAAEAIEQAVALSRAGKNAYFACAEYLTPDNRTAANVTGAWGFWMDLDCGNGKAASGKGYSTEQEAEAALKAFCKKTEIPESTHIVHSGSGLHAYWVLDRLVDRETWQTYAVKLKALTQKLAFLADNSRTSDIASVLRVPGTLNYKYQPPRPVTLIHAAGDRVVKAAMLDAIDAAQNRLCVVPATPQVRPCTNAAMPGADGNGDGSRCEQPIPPTSPFLRAPIEPASVTLRLIEVILKYLDPDSEYYDWLHVGMAIHFETRGSNEGFRLFDKWSCAGKAYKGKNDTKAKWRSFKADRKTYFTRGTLFWMAKLEGISPERIYAEAEAFQKIGGQNGAA